MKVLIDKLNLMLLMSTLLKMWIFAPP